MHERASDDFDFDEWAELYRCDPAAFEARREVLLGIELARGDERQRERGRDALARYERAAVGLDTWGRLQLAASCMSESAEALKGSLARLGECSLREAGALPDDRSS